MMARDSYLLPLFSWLPADTGMRPDVKEFYSMFKNFQNSAFHPSQQNYSHLHNLILAVKSTQFRRHRSDTLMIKTTTTMNDENEHMCQANVLHLTL